jgi:hypothetical protein
MTMAFHCGFMGTHDLSVTYLWTTYQNRSNWEMRPGNKRGETTTDSVISNGYEIDWKEIEHETSIG